MRPSSNNDGFTFFRPQDAAPTRMMMASRFPLKDRKRWLIAVYFALYLGFWCLFPLLTDRPPHSDNLEQLDWAQQAALGYSKHPPLPTWIVIAAQWLYPGGVLMTYVFGALTSATACAVAALLSQRLQIRMPPWIAAVLVTFITYYTIRLRLYNHNTTLLVSYAMAAYVSWRAVETPRTRWWIALGMCWGAGMLCKYQALVGIACGAAFVLLAPGLAARARIGGLAIAGTIASAVFAPHVYWLVQNDFSPLRYAATFVTASLDWLQRLDEILGFLLYQLGRLGYGIVGVWLLLHFSRPVAGHVFASKTTLFLVIHALGPFALIVALCAVGGMDLESHWGTPYLWLLPLWWLTTAQGQRIATLDAGKILIVGILLQVAMATQQLL